MIYHALDSNGGFVCGDSVTGITSYAYPTSEHATKAKKKPGQVALEMIKWEMNLPRDSDSGRQYDMRNWKLLHDSMRDHTVRGIIDSITERGLVNGNH